MKKSFLSCMLVFLLSTYTFAKQVLNVQLMNQNTSMQVQYAVDKIKELQKSGVIRLQDFKSDLIIKTELDAVRLKPEAFKIVSNKSEIKVSGGDAVGLMYGLLEVKNQLRAGKRTIESKSESPNLMFRAIKFNLPWDSYRRSPALQLHHETCRDTTYWKEFLDMMVDNRFNKLTLWNLHPFSYMVKTKKYPEGCSLSDKELAEWQVFWKKLFRMAKIRGIETYIVNWNIFVSPEFAKAHNVCDYCLKGSHLAKQGDTTAITKDFYRESIKAVIDTYPELTGLGITLGEGMGNMTPKERQDWILESYIQGVRMASRKIKFIYRVPLSAGTGSAGATSIETEILTRSVLDTLTCFDGPINIELKYNWSHAFSTPHLVKVHGGKLNDVYWNPFPKNYYLAWMIRNEDFFMLRWGQPDFVRKHLAMNVHPHVNGYYVGSETYIPAKDYITSLPGTSYRYAFERQWMFYKVIGRLLYNPQTPDAYFKNEFVQRFPKLGAKLFQAQTLVSKVPLVIASWYNATWDFTLYSEGMLSSIDKSVKLISLANMADKTPMDPDYLSISDYLKNENNIPKNKISPLQLADSLTIDCNKALELVKNIISTNNTDLLYEVSDIKAWANLGLYFSNKLKAAVEYKRYMISKNRNDLTKSIQHLTVATANWHTLVEVTKPVYKPVELMHYGENLSDDDMYYFHWSKVEKEVIEELETLSQNNIPQNIMIHTFDSSNVERKDFHKYTNWYQENGNTQTFKLHPGDCNTRNTRKYCRIEAHTKLQMKQGEAYEFTATFNIGKCQETVCVFQVFNSTVIHPQLYIKILPNGNLHYQSRGNESGLIANNVLKKDFTLHVKDDGYRWQLFYNGKKISEGPHQEKGKNSICEFRWGLYNNNIPTTEIMSTVRDVSIVKK